MKRTILLLCCVLGVCISGFAAEETLIRDPYKYVWDIADEGEVAGMTRFFLDLDNDGTPELFLAANSLIGNGGGPFHVFKKAMGGYREIGEVFISPGDFQVMPQTHQGYHDIKACNHLSAESCTLVTYVYDGAEYKKTTDKVVKGESGKKEILATPVNAERSERELAWKIEQPDSRAALNLNQEPGSHFSLQFDGQVKSGERFSREIKKGLFFVLDPGKSDSGWTITIRSDKSASNYAGITPPFHGPNPTVLVGSDFADAAPLMSKDTRDFRFVTNETDEKEIWKEIELYTSGQTQRDNCEKSCCIFCRPIGHGELFIKNYKVGKKNREKPWLTPLYELKFWVKLEFPASQ